METIRPINIEDLKQLEPLLRFSFGQSDFDIQDKIECFNEQNPDDWFALWHNEIPQGFIRYFPVDKHLYIAELYITLSSNPTTLEILLRHFLSFNKLPKDAILRLDLLAEDKVKRTLFEQLFPKVATKTFLYFEFNFAKKEVLRNSSSPPASQLEQIQTILSPLKLYPIQQLKELSETGQLFSLEIDGVVKAALHYETRHKDCEIITLATGQNDRNKGYGTELLLEFFQCYSNRFETLFLKVNKDNPAALRLYEKVGFIQNKSKTQIWWYIPLQPIAD
jgi:ribosomal protein S18 acetylase RimI-like enzyme